uniref:Uncharacterized protein n=1 Tax=Rhizophora mucronata TaxID=61149 RepID=A0A2P2R0E8_RHIMU
MITKICNMHMIVSSTSSFTRAHEHLYAISSSFQIQHKHVIAMNTRICNH